jgi:2'-5' RNA ligase
MIRAFIALDIPSSIREEAKRIQSRLRGAPLSSRVSWSKIDNLHLTLQFLGDIPEPLVSDVSRALDVVSARHNLFALSVRGVGAFPHAARARVLWIGCQDTHRQLEKLADDIRLAMIPLGFEPEQRPFAGHLTLGRIKFPRPDAALTRALDSFKDTDLGAMQVEAIHLFQSQLQPQGSIYTKLSTHCLGSAPAT